MNRQGQPRRVETTQMPVGGRRMMDFAPRRKIGGVAGGGGKVSGFNASGRGDRAGGNVKGVANGGVKMVGNVNVAGSVRVVAHKRTTNRPGVMRATQTTGKRPLSTRGRVARTGVQPISVAKQTRTERTGVVRVVSQARKMSNGQVQRAPSHQQAQTAPHQQQARMVTEETEILRTPVGQLVAQEEYTEVDFGVVEDYDGEYVEKLARGDEGHMEGMTRDDRGRAEGAMGSDGEKNDETRSDAKDDKAGRSRVKTVGVAMQAPGTTGGAVETTEKTTEKTTGGTVGKTKKVSGVTEKRRNWPFLQSVQVEKRPLSGGARPAKKAAKPVTTVTPAASSIALNSAVTKKGSKLPIIGLVLLTVILGVAVGAAVYFAIFQSGGPE